MSSGPDRINTASGLIHITQHPVSNFSLFHSSMDSDSDSKNPVAASAAYGGDEIQHVDESRWKNKATTHRAAAKQFGVDPKRVREWLANKHKILATPKRRQKIDRGRRKPTP